MKTNSLKNNIKINRRGKRCGMRIFSELSSMGTVNIGGWNPLDGIVSDFEFNNAFSVDLFLY